MRKVLVVEDSPAMLGLIASIIDEVGDCDVVEASNGFEALKLLPRHSFSLIISDINMPDINGLELLSYIRRNEDYINTPVVIVTSDSGEIERERVMALGASAFLVKPFVKDELLNTARRLLDAPGGDAG